MESNNKMNFEVVVCVYWSNSCIWTVYMDKWRTADDKVKNDFCSKIFEDCWNKRVILSICREICSILLLVLRM